MTMNDTWVLTLRKNDMTVVGTDVFQINIQLPDAKRFSNFKVSVKDFIVLRHNPQNALPLTQPITIFQDKYFSLASDTLRCSNNYDSRTGISNILASVPNLSSSFYNSSDIYFDLIGHINGLHKFWLEDEFGDVQTSDFYDTFLIVLVVKGYN